MDMLPFLPDTTASASAGLEKSIPKDLDIFFRSESDFLPDGKKFADLTAEEDAEIRIKYRFSGYRPGIYHGDKWVGDIRIGRTKHGVL